jgi:chitin-binding protein
MQVRRIGVLVVGIAAAAAVAISASDNEAQAHGSTQMPPSRIYSCRFEQPDNPMCAAAWDANEQALYDWMEVNIGDANGRHQQLIPDGELCSAGRDKYAALDQPGDWPLTALQPNSAGLYDVVFTNTAPHATAYYRILLTRPGFDARNDPLRWADLEQVYDSGAMPAASLNRFSLALPERQEPAVLYVIWQRSDSPEAFYACSDVTIGAGGAPPPPSTPSTTTTMPQHPDHPTSTSPSTPTTTPSSPPDESGDGPSSPVADLVTTETTTAAWDGGRCVELRVENQGSKATSWEVYYAPGGEIAALWNARDEGSHHEHLAFVGEDWNERLDPGEWTTFGMCVDTVG